MENKKFFSLIALFTTLLFCLTSCVPNIEPDQQQNDPVATSAVEKVLFELARETDEEFQDLEYAIITGVDAAGEVVWSHMSGKYLCAMLDTVEEVLCTDTQYIYCEEGTVVSLDIATGEVLWKNSEFKGYGVCGLEADDGNLYICGYLGTSFFVVEETGKTVHKIESFGEEYAWAYKIQMDRGKIAVTLGLGPEELHGPGGYVMLIDPVDYSFFLQSPAE